MRLMSSTDSHKYFLKGFSFVSQNKWESVIDNLKRVRLEDDISLYARAQFGIGLAYQKLGDAKNPIIYWSKIKQEWNNVTFADAQYNLGVFYLRQNKLENAIECWRKISQQDNRETFALANFNMGVAFDKKRKTSKAIEHWNLVSFDDSAEAFSDAQFNLGLVFKKRREWDKAIDCFKNVRASASANRYYYAMLHILELFATKKFPLYNAYAREVRESIQKGEWDTVPFLKGVLCKILKMNMTMRRGRIFSLLLYVVDILSTLQVWSSLDDEVAHYTRPDVANLLLQGKSPHGFRLNTINKMNDPLEGKVFLQRVLNNTHISKLSNYQNSEMAFIACFTFNHDSLNQFRLYGKENNEEASGVSLVIKNTFFDTTPGVHSFYNQLIAEDHSDQRGKGVLAIDDSSTERTKLPLYRCVYIDPESDYVYLSRRNSVTFYRNNQQNVLAMYDKSLRKAERRVTNSLKGIKSTLSSLLANKNSELELVTTISFIIKPLCYLVKHVAFQEEQECRMVYITNSVRDAQVKKDSVLGAIYYEYFPLLDHLEKVWLSPKAAQKEEFFITLLGERKKVQCSRNPFRTN